MKRLRLSICIILFLYLLSCGIAYASGSNKSLARAPKTPVEYSLKTAPLDSAQVANVRGDIAALKALARRGNAEAQFLLGLDYEHAQGVPRDYSEAARWYRKAAEQGNASAQWCLGNMYNVGMMGFPQAALSRMTPSEIRRARISRTSVPQDYAKAAKWLLMAAEQGDATAQRNLADLYLHGQGVPKDYVRAYMWLSLSIITHFPGGCARFDKIAVSNGYPGGCAQLSKTSIFKVKPILLAGIGEPFFSVDRECGDCAELDATAAKMTPSQVAEAVRLIRQWKPKVHDDRWILFTSRPGAKYYYDAKSIDRLTEFIKATGKEIGTTVKVWVREMPQNGKASMSRWVIDCTERTYDDDGLDFPTTDIKPGSLQEGLFNIVCNSGAGN